MKKLSKASMFTTLGALVVIYGAIILPNQGQKERTFVLLSTNDMHAQIDKFPSLATAIEQCRDTADVILVDAGDRWTGNAFVDMVEYYTPIYELMNYLDYDVTIYGNHEFDKGQDYLAVANRQASFPIIGANIKSDTTSFPQPLGHHIVKVGDKKIAFVGVVGNYDANNHPAGKDESYAGLTFSNPHTSAAEYSYLSDECDMLVLISHSGLERDTEFAASPLSEGYDHIVSAHSHDLYVGEVNGKLISQTGSRLKNIGATVVTINAEGEVKLSHSNIPLSTYEPDATVAEMVKNYYNNPELTAPIGKTEVAFNEIGVCNLFTETVRKSVKADIGLYNAGGVRIDTIAVGEISTATVLNAEPFNSHVAKASMSVDNLKELVMTKFNDKVNIGEAHYIDLVMTTPYTVITDESGDAVDIIFPELNPKKRYTVAMGDYVYKTYRGLNYSKGEITEITVVDELKKAIMAQDVITPLNEELQSIEPQK